MNRQEMIEAWKKNTTVFGEMSKEMREFAKEIPSNNFFYRTNNDGWRRKCGELYGGTTYRLKSDYAEQPDEIAVDIKRSESSKSLILTTDKYDRLDSRFAFVAPSISPKDGYVFLCYEFEDGRRHKDYWMYKTADRCIVVYGYSKGDTPIFATKAIYVKEGK